MKGYWVLIFILLSLLLAGCAPSSPVCPPGSVTYFGASEPVPAVQPGASGLTTIDLGGKTIEVNQVLRGPLCHARLSGTVYVACDIQVKKWEGAPNFLSGCDFQVEPQTVIYVAAHNNAAYYNGCLSCHAVQAIKP